MITPRQFVAGLLEDWNNPSAAPRPGEQQDDQIGDDVTVVSDGEAFQGKIAKKDPRDSKGRVQVSFKGPRPPKDEFEPDQLRHDDPKNGPKPATSPRPVPPVSSREGRGPGSFL
jgi:hypothetical protein